MGVADVERVGLWVKPEPVLKMGMGMGQSFGIKCFSQLKTHLHVKTLSKGTQKHFLLSLSSKNRPPEKMKRGGRSCSDAVVGWRAAASEPFLLFFLKIFMSNASTPPPLSISRLRFSRQTTYKPRSKLIDSNLFFLKKRHGRTANNNNTRQRRRQRT